MFATPDTSTATLSYLLDQVHLNPPAIIQEGSSNNLSHLIFTRNALGDVRIFATTDTAWVSSAALMPSLDAWTHDTLNAIAAHRHLGHGWDGRLAVAPSNQALDTAETLAQAFAFAPTSRRPSFSVDVEGNPSFASYSDELYLHLTVDRPGVVSWYAVKNGDEYFRDDVEIDGLNLEKLATEILMMA